MFLMTAERARAQLATMGRAYDPGSFTEAAEEGDANAVSLFLRSGMKADARRQPGTPSALDFAMDEHHFDVAKILIQAGPTWSIRCSWLRAAAIRSFFIC